MEGHFLMENSMFTLIYKGDAEFRKEMSCALSKVDLVDVYESQFHEVHVYKVDVYKVDVKSIKETSNP